MATKAWHATIIRCEHRCKIFIENVGLSTPVSDGLLRRPLGEGFLCVQKFCHSRIDKIYQHHQSGQVSFLTHGSMPVLLWYTWQSTLYMSVGDSVFCTSPPPPIMCLAIKHQSYPFGVYPLLTIYMCGLSL